MAAFDGPPADLQPPDDLAPSPSPATVPDDLQPPVDLEAPPQARDEGIGAALELGLKRGIQGIGQTAEAITGGKPKPIEPESVAEQPLQWSDLLHPERTAEKLAYGVASSAPSIAAFAGGAALGELAFPGGGGIVAGPLAAGAVSAAQTLGPKFAAELQQTPNDPDGAFDRAAKSAATEGATTGISFAAFGFAPFRGAVKNVLFQAFGVQPGINVTGREVENRIEGHPREEGVSEEYLQSVAGTLTPAAGHAVLRGAGRLADAVFGEGAAAAAPPEDLQESETQESRRQNRMPRTDALDELFGGAPRIQDRPGGAAPDNEAPQPNKPRPPIDVKPIRDDTATTAMGTDVPVRYGIVSANVLVASQTDDMRANPDYPDGVQPRDRSRRVSEAQITDMSKNLRPRELDQSPTAANGAPIVDPGGVVESGNARALAIRRAYQQGLPSAAAYRDYLTQQGYPVGDIADPVLVRVRTNDMTPAERLQFVREANDPGVLRMGTSEQAVADARALPDSVLDLYRGGDVESADNRDFVRAFVGNVVNRSEAGAFVGPDGSLSVDGVRRINAAMLAKAYGEPNLLAKVLESPDLNIRAIAGGLTDIAPDWARVAAQARAGSIPPEMDQTANLLQAVRLVQMARQRGIPLGDLVGQKNIFTGGAIAPETEAFLGLMFKDPGDWLRPLARSGVARGLGFFVDEASKTHTGADMLGERSPPPLDILNLARRRLVPDQPEMPSGSAAAPAAATQPADVEAARNRTAVAPTEAQVQAGNYSKGHVEFQGMQVSIETPRGTQRQGKSPDGSTWSNVNPFADYGYVRSTEGADGEQVDVYLGPHADSPDAFVFDQIDPATGKFDEHKAVLGARDEDEARQIYDAGFSDGSGPARRGAVTAMPVDEFKQWAESARAKRPLAYREPAAPVAPTPPESAPTEDEIRARAEQLGIEPWKGTTREEIAAIVHTREQTTTPESQAAAKAEEIAKEVDAMASEVTPEVVDDEGWRRASTIERDAVEGARAPATEPEPEVRPEEAPGTAGAPAQPAGGGGAGEPGSPVPGEGRTLDDNGKPIFKKGDRVVITGGEGQGRHGVIQDANSITWATIFGGKVSRSYHYIVKSDGGATFNAGNEMEPERDKAPEVVPDPIIDGFAQTPQSLSHSIAHSADAARRAHATADRARLQKNKQEARDRATAHEKEAQRLRGILDAWKQKHPEESERIFGAPNKPIEGAPATAAPVPQSPRNDVTVTENDARDGVEVRFKSRPDDATIGKLKGAGFRWSKPQRLWYAKRSDRTRQVAKELSTRTPEAKVPEVPASPSATAEPNIAVSKMQTRAGYTAVVQEGPFRGLNGQGLSAEEALETAKRKLADAEAAATAATAATATTATTATTAMPPAPPPIEPDEERNAWEEFRKRSERFVPVMQEEHRIGRHLARIEVWRDPVNDRYYNGFDYGVAGISAGASPVAEPSFATAADALNEVKAHLTDIFVGIQRSASYPDTAKAGAKSLAEWVARQELPLVTPATPAPGTPTAKAETTAATEAGSAEMDADLYQPSAMPVTSAVPKPSNTSGFRIGDQVRIKPEHGDLVRSPGSRYVTAVSPDGSQITLDGGLVVPQDWIERLPRAPVVTKSTAEEPQNGIPDLLSQRPAGPGSQTVPGAGAVRPNPPASEGQDRGSLRPAVPANRPAAEGAGQLALGPAGTELGGGAGAVTNAGLPGGGEGPAPRTPARSAGGKNFAIVPGALEEGRGPTVKARDNLAAIELAKKLTGEGRPATPDEQTILAKYVGWGGLAGAFPNPSTGKFGAGLEDVGRRLKEVLSANEYKEARSSTQYAHYTSESIIGAMWNAVRTMGFDGGNVFEPGMGVGHFLGLMPPDMAAKSRYEGIELDPVTAAIAKLLYPQSGVRQADFTRITIPENSFDLVIGNPPFADTVIKADKKYAARSFMTHDYFFAKSIDSVRPGGLLAFVTSAGTMNKIDPAARHYLAERAEFLGGVRLPSNAFKRNAGTEVTTDVLFFKKRPEALSYAEAQGLPDFGWTATMTRDLPDAQGNMKSGNVSRYFSEHPEQVIGHEGFFDKLYKDRYAVHAPEGLDFGAALSAAMARLPKDVYEPPVRDTGAGLDFQSPERKEGSFYVDGAGRLMQFRDGAGREVQKRGTEGGLTTAERERVARLIPLRNALREVYAADLGEDVQKGVEARRQLNRHYDDFVRKFGPINKADHLYRRPNIVQQEYARAEAREEARERGEPWSEGDFNAEAPEHADRKVPEIARLRQLEREKAVAAGRNFFDEGTFQPEEMPDIVIERRPNVDAFMDDPESYRLRAIENYDEKSGQASKKRIFYESVLTREQEPLLKSAQDGVLWSLNKFGRFDVAEIAAKMKRPESDIIAELGDSVFKVPGTRDTYQMADEYLSGDVVTKLAEATHAATQDPDVRRNIDALRAVQPVPLPPSEISMALGMPWIPTSVYERFADDKLGFGNADVRHSPLAGGYLVKRGGAMQWGTPEVPSSKIFEHALNHTSPRVYTKNSDGSSSFDPVATQAAIDKIQVLANAFAEYPAIGNQMIGGWLSEQDDVRTNLADLYNEQMNRVVPRRHDGSYLVTPGIAKDFSWRPHQRRGVARIVQSGNTYLAHAVGSGKAQPLDAKVLTPDGWRTMGEIEVGDFVIAGDGTPTQVEAVYPQGEKEIFRVRFSDGAATECCAEHLWLTQTYEERGYSQKGSATGKTWPCGHAQVRQLSEIARSLISSHLRAKNHSIPMVGAVHFNCRAVPVDPYLMGVLLGDGSFRDETVRLSTTDPEILDYVMAVIPNETEIRHKDRCDYVIAIAGGRRSVCGAWIRNPLKDAIRSMGLWGLMSHDKFIPECYLRNAVEVRVAILQGLLDTDGWVSKRGHSTYFTSTSSRLADGIIDLVQSLGGKATITRKEPHYTHGGIRLCGRTAYNVCLSLPPSVMPFRLSRKAKHVVPKSKYRPTRYITSVEKIGRKQARCIRVAHPSHLYVTDDYIVTHNTAEAIGAVMEMRRLGLINKAMVTVPNHMLAQFTNDFYQQYPTAKLAVADERRFHTSRRKQFIASVAQDDLDAVVITHSAFGKIPVSDAFQSQLIDEQIQQITDAMADIDKSDRITVKRLENKKKKLEQKLRAAMQGAKDLTNTFEELGVDFLIVDEAHIFRKLDFGTRQNIKGISPEGSQMAFDLYSKIRYLESRRPGRSAVLMSGTPITNTMGEMYTLQRYLQPQELAARGLSHFDSWSAAFGRAIAGVEETPAGDYQVVTRFSRFVNAPELYKMVAQVMDVVTPSQLDQYVVRPKLKDGKRQLHLAPRTTFLDQFQAALRDRILAIEARHGPPKKGQDILLSVINDGRHGAIDPRFIGSGTADTADELLPADYQDSKLNQMIDNIFDIWKRTADTQFYDPASNYTKPSMRGPATQIVFSNLGVNPRGPLNFSGYKWIRQRLIQMGVPKEQIAFIGDYKNHVARQKLYNDMNEGRVRILVGSTQKMGTGINVQKRLYAGHNLDPLWYPSDDEQRVARPLRQGNHNPLIEIHDYSTKGTYDATMWQMMGRKARSIEQFFRGDPTLRDIEDLGEASQYEQASAMSTSDERVIKLTEMKHALDRLQRSQVAHDREQYSFRSGLKHRQEEVESIDKQMPLAEADVSRRVDTRGDAFTMKVGGVEFTKRAEAAEALEKLAKEADVQTWKDRAPIWRKVGEISSFPVLFRRYKSADKIMAEFALELSGGRRQDLRGYSTGGILRSAEDAVASLEDTVDYLKQRRASATAAIASLQSQLGKPFASADELARLTSDTARLEHDLKGGLPVPSALKTVGDVDKALRELPALSFLGDAERRGLEAALQQRRADIERGQSTGTAGPKFALREREEAAAAPAFYSTLTRAAESAKLEKGAPGQWEATLRNMAGVRPEEIEWSGILPWLREQKPPVTKQQVVDFLRANEIHVHETEKGGALIPEAAINRIRRWIEQNRDQPLTDQTGTGLTEEDMQEVANLAGARSMDDETVTDILDGVREGNEQAVGDLEQMGVSPDLLRPIYDAMTGGGTKFGAHTLPGGRNYRELLLTLPETPRQRAAKAVVDAAQRSFEEGRAAERQYGIPYTEAINEFHAASDFRSSHWSEPNVLAHVRFDDRTGPNGEKILHVAEVQSDWHQKGRKSGYATPRVVPAPVDHLPEGWRGAVNEHGAIVLLDPDGRLIAAEAVPHGEAMPDIARKALDLYNRERRDDALTANEFKVPNAPFKTTWQELAAKRMLRYAAENGYDRLSWDTGEENVRRYREALQKAADRIEWEKTPDGVHLIASKDGRTVSDTRERENAVSDAIGKSMADKIKNDPNQKGVITGKDITISDTGMAGFYDRILPQFLNKYAKKWGAKVEDTQIHPDISPRLKELDSIEDRRGLDEPERRERSQLMKTRKSVTVHSVAITPAMRDSVMGGQALFARKAATPAAVSARVSRTEVTPEGIQLLFQPKFDKQRMKVANDVRAVLHARGFSDAIAFRVADTILNSDGADADGYYLNRTIVIALDAKNPMAVLDHEIIHALRHLGLFTRGEWRILEREAHFKWLRQYAPRLAAYNDGDDKVEEAVAFAAMDSPARSGAGGFAQRLFQRMRDFFSALGNALRGDGFKTAQSIFRDIRSGEFGRRLKKAAPRGRAGAAEAASTDPHFVFATFDEAAQVAKEDTERFGKEYRPAKRFDPEHGTYYIVKQVGAEHPGSIPFATEPRDAEQELATRKSSAALPEEPGAVDAKGRPLPQLVIPGAERSARQAAAARAATPKIAPTAPQRAAGDLFARSPEEQPDMFAARAKFALRTPSGRTQQGAQMDDRRARLNKAFTRLMGEGAQGALHKIGEAADRFAPDSAKELLGQLQMAVTPMSAGTPRARAAAKDFANALRLSRHQWGKVDEWLSETFTPEQRRRMWDAADQESVIRQEGRDAAFNEGLNTLSPEERATVEELQQKANASFEIAQKLGMTQAEGLPSYTPRMFVRMTEGGPENIGRGESMGAKIGRNLRTSTGQLKRRKHLEAEESEAAAKAKLGEGTEMVRDIRTLGLATRRLDEAIAGRRLIDQVKQIGEEVGEETAVEGEAAPGFFTLDHPAFRQWRPAFTTDAETGRVVPREDQDGNIIYTATPIYISKEFEGPLKAVLDQAHTSGIYKSLMSFKGKTMSVIMYSPLIHNAVIWGKSIPADPLGVLSFRAYFRGNAAKNNPEVMREAISAGLDPIGHRYFNQDLTAIAAPEQARPGRSWTAQVLGAIPGLFDRELGDALRRRIDAFGDLWHNAFLWDRVADLQMGLYLHVRDHARAAGADATSAARMAAHFANRYAGALPLESMSRIARATANMVMFSRSFTLGNLGAFKDVIAGLPQDVQGQILRDKGTAALNRVQGLARRKALAMLALDIALSRVGLILAAYAAYLLRQDGLFVSPSENEPGKEQRFLIGYNADGTALYGRLPTGKVGEEMTDWASEPLDLFKRKLSPYARLAYEVAANDIGYGRKLYDPYADTPSGLAKNMGRIAWQAMSSIVPTGLIEGAIGLASGAATRKATAPALAASGIAVPSDRGEAAMEAFLPMLGITVSHGAPGGPAAGELLHARDEQAFRVQEAMPSIRAKIRNGDTAGAIRDMTALGMDPGQRRGIINTTLNPQRRVSPGALSRFGRYATPEEMQRLQQLREAQPRRQPQPQ